MLAALALRWRWIIIYVVGSYVVVAEKIKFVHLDPRHGNWDHWQQLALDNLQAAPPQYRTLSYLFPEVFCRLGMSTFDAYMLVRYLCTLGICILLHHLWRPWLRGSRYVVGLLLFFLLYMLTVLPMPQPAEPINILFFAGCYLCIQRGWLLLLQVLIFVGSLNKFTMIFLAPVVCLHLLFSSGQRDLKTWALALGHGISALLIPSMVRLAVIQVLGPRRYITEFWMIQRNLKWMKTSLAGWHVVLLVVAPMVTVWATWSRQPALIRAHSLMLPLFLIFHFLITVLAEGRTQVLTLLLTIPAVVPVLLGPGEPRGEGLAPPPHAGA